MKWLGIVLALAASFVSPGLNVYPQSKPPALYVDKGACPFECCTYRRWRTEKTTVAYARPDKGSRRVGQFKAGSNVVALTGEVHTVPGKFVIMKEHAKYKSGDVLWVYTPLGEGSYKVWFKGRMYSEKLDYMSGPFERSTPGCEGTPECWGKLAEELRTVWWIKIKSPDGWVGWTDQPDDFGDKDACG